MQDFARGDLALMPLLALHEEEAFDLLDHRTDQRRSIGKIEEYCGHGDVGFARDLGMREAAESGTRCRGQRAFQ